MKRWVCFLLAACLVALLVQASEARINQMGKATGVKHQLSDAEGTQTVEDQFFNDLHIGALWFPAVSNKGYIGYSDITAFYPGGGDQSNLWQAGMMAAGYLELDDGFYPNAFRYYGLDGDVSDPASYDALDKQAVVETEADFGYPFPYRRLTIEVNTANKPLDPPGDPVDGDLGMNVKYVWHQWGVAGYDNWVFVDVTIEFTKAIKDFYWGWLSDCDVGDVNLPDVYFDDYAGWDEDLQFCYMRDWDYDPLANQAPAPSTADSLFLSPNVLGQILLAAPVVNGPVSGALDPAQKWVSKNFWDWNNDISSVQNSYDRLAGIWENPFPPENDFDYRILNGVGPYQAEAGDVAHFWMAYVIGEGYDNDEHATFGLGTLVEHVNDAQAFFDGGMVIPASAYAPQAPDLDPDLGADVDADVLTLHWAPYANLPSPGVEADSFRVYTGTISRLGPWAWVKSLDKTVTETTVELIPGFYTYAWVEAYNSDNEAGSNPYALSSRLYAVDEDGILRANNNTIASVIGNSPAAETLDEVTVAPNPYVGSNAAELEEYATLLGFHNLPSKCTIYIYNLSGNLVDIVHHDSQSGSEFWDMTTRSDEAISSGLYVYRVKAEDGGEKLGKFAVIKGQR
jgi:hypothetical protein